MKKIILIVSLILNIVISAHSQSVINNSIDNTLNFNLAISEQSFLTNSSQQNLENILTQYLRPNEVINGEIYVSRFLIKSSLSKISEETLSESKLKYVNLDLNLNILDIYEGKNFNSYTISLKGVGNTDEKAYNDAILKLRNQKEQLIKFLNTSETKIVNYYNQNCSEIEMAINNLVKQNKFDEALLKLSSIPYSAKTCLKMVNENLSKVYNMKINFQCSNIVYLATLMISKDEFESAYTLLETIPPSSNCFNESKKTLNELENKSCSYYLGKAQAAWATKDIELAKKYLMNISSNSKCDNKVQELVKEINSWTKSKIDKEFSLEVKKLDNDHSLQKSTIEAARAIGMAYANSQPKTIYYNNQKILW